MPRRSLLPGLFILLLFLAGAFAQWDENVDPINQRYFKYQHSFRQPFFLGMNIYRFEPLILEALSLVTSPWRPRSPRSMLSEFDSFAARIFVTPNNWCVRLVVRGTSIPFWDVSGSALITPDYVRLTPDEQSKKGGIWNTKVRFSLLGPLNCCACWQSKLFLLSAKPFGSPVFQTTRLPISNIGKLIWSSLSVLHPVVVRMASRFGTRESEWLKVPFSATRINGPVLPSYLTLSTMMDVVTIPQSTPL